MVFRLFGVFMFVFFVGVLLLRVYCCWCVGWFAVWRFGWVWWFSAALLWCLIVWLLADCLGCGVVCCCLRWVVAFDWSLGVGYFGLHAFGWFGGLCL